METWVNDPAIKQELGVQPSLTFEPRNMGVNQGFASQDDGMKNSALLLTNLLVYAGTAGMCPTGIQLARVLITN